jgi:hypothetical protein
VGNLGPKENNRMYEVKSCGVVIDSGMDHMQASITFDRSPGAVVELFRYNADGNKVLVRRKFSSLPTVNSKKK